MCAPQPSSYVSARQRRGRSYKGRLVRVTGRLTAMSLGSGAAGMHGTSRRVVRGQRPAATGTSG
jgi:hypothetical protein